MTDDRTLGEIARLDPTIGDAPPAPGSTRHLSILEHAMTAIDDLHTSDASDPAPAHPRPHRRPGRRAAVLVAVAAVVALVVGIALLGPASDPEPASATEALAIAAMTTGDATTLRIEATYERPDSTKHLVGEANGTDYRIESSATYPDGHEEHETTIVIGDTVWEDGAKRTVPAEERNGAYAPSSEAVVEAILDGSTLDDLGEQYVRGTTARHIRATLTERSRAALRALSPSQVAMFELEYPDEVGTIDLWVADDLIRRIQLTVDEGRDGSGTPVTNAATIEFYDFGADIAIRPPD